MNSVNFVGRVGKDAEQRFIPSGDAVCSFSLAVDRAKKAGAKQDPLWLTVTLWGKYAEAMAPFLTKGKEIAVQGELQPVREYKTSGGEARFSLEVRGEKIRLCGGGEPNGRSDRAAQSAPARITDEDIPF